MKAELSARSNAEKGIVYLVGAGPGDPGLITVRGLQCLQQAEVIVYDRLVSPALFDYAPQAEWIDVGKKPDHHPIPQQEINRILVEQAQLGRIVVRLKGGDPFVFGRGGEEALALVQAGVPFEVVPGVTSAIAVPAYAGIPVTQRGLVSNLAIITGHRLDQPGGCADQFDQCALEADTRVFLMGVHNLPNIVQRLLESGCSSDTPVAVIEQGTTPAQKVTVGTLATILEQSAGIRPPAITVVGEVVRLRDQLRWFDLPDRRPLLGLKVLNTRPKTTSRREALAEQLESLGALVLNMPAIKITPLSEFQELDRVIGKIAFTYQNWTQGAEDHPAYDWILFTSANAVAHFLDRLFALGYDARILAGTRIGAVGKATAAKLSEYRLAVDFMPSRFTGAAWAAEVEDIDGKSVLLPRSEIGAEETVLSLEARGARVEVVSVYSVQPCEPDQAILDQLGEGQVDVITFFSPSAVRSTIQQLVDAFGEERAYGILRGCTIACVGPVTSQAAQEAGLRVDLTAREYTVEGLVEALTQWRRGH